MKEVSTKELLAWQNERKQFVFLDTRSFHYYNWEHIQSTENLRWNSVKEQAAVQFPNKNTTIVTSCQSLLCDASVKAAKAFLKMGYKNIYEYAGGISEWKAYGLPTEINTQHKITTNIYRIPGQTFYGNEIGNYLIEDEQEIVIVDGPQNLDEALEDFILSFNKPIKLFLTHDSTAGQAEQLRKKYKAKIYLHAKDKSGPYLKITPDVLFKNDIALTKYLKIIHTPGHTPGSSCLYDVRSKAVLAGDHLQGNSQGGLREFDNSRNYTDWEKTWSESILKIAKLNPELILPFHGAMIRTGSEKILNELKKRSKKCKN